MWNTLSLSTFTNNIQQQHSSNNTGPLYTGLRVVASRFLFYSYNNTMRVVASRFLFIQQFPPAACAWGSSLTESAKLSGPELGH